MNLNELLRLLLNLVRIGRVIEVDHAKAMIRVQSGDLQTNWIRWLAFAAGETTEWAPPSIKEQVLLLSPGGDLAGAVALRGLYADDNPPPSNAPTVYARKFPDGTLLEYDSFTHHLAATFAAGGSIVINCPDSVTIKTKDAVIEAETITLKAEKTSCLGQLSVTGDIEAGANVKVTGIVTATDVKAGPISLKFHKNPGGGVAAP